MTCISVAGGAREFFFQGGGISAAMASRLLFSPIFFGGGEITHLYLFGVVLREGLFLGAGFR